MDLWEQLEKIQNPYGRFAWLVDHCISHGASEGDTLIEEIERYPLPAGLRIDREEQVRNYCELSCTSYPVELVRMLPDWLLVELVRQHFGANWREVAQITAEQRPMWVTRRLGFEPPPTIGTGLQYRINELEQARSELASGRTTKHVLLGCGDDAFNTAESILEEMLSFYGRCLWGAHYVEQIINDLGLHRGIEPRDWKLRKWRDDPEYQLTLGVLIPLFERMDELLLESPDAEPGVRLRRLFSRDSIIPFPRERGEPFPLGLLKKVKEMRENYIHRRDAVTTENTPILKAKTELLIETLLEFASLMVNDVFPRTIIMQRRMMLESGEVRLDYLDEQLQPCHVRFWHGPIPFYPRIPVYYFQPRAEAGHKAAVLPPPILVPVDEHWKGEVL